jgi:hypothetical protein
VRSEGGSTLTKLSAPTRWADLIAFYVSSLGGAVAKDYASLEDAEETEEEEKGTGTDTEMDKKAENKKKKSQTLALTNAIADLVPELVARLMTDYAGSLKKLEKGNMGGVLLHTPDANIGLHAGTTIGLHANRGMLLYSGNNIDANLGVHYDDTIWKWGSKKTTIPSDDEYDKRMFNFYDVEAMKYIFRNINIAANASTTGQPGFLADVSALRYSSTTNRVDIAGQKHVSLARKHILHLVNPTRRVIPAIPSLFNKPTATTLRKTTCARPAKTREFS